MADVLLALGAAQPPEECHLASGLGPGMLRNGQGAATSGEGAMVVSPGNLTEHSTWISERIFESEPLCDVGEINDELNSN